MQDVDEQRAEAVPVWRTKRFRFWAGWVVIALMAAGFPLIVWAVESSRGDRTEAVRAHELVEKVGLSDEKVLWTDVRSDDADGMGDRTEVLAILTDEDYSAALDKAGATTVCKVAGPVANVPEAYVKAPGTFTLYEIPGAESGRTISAVVLTESADENRVFLVESSGAVDRARCIA